MAKGVVRARVPAGTGTSIEIEARRDDHRDKSLAPDGGRVGLGTGLLSSVAKHQASRKDSGQADALALSRFAEGGAREGAAPGNAITRRRADEASPGSSGWVAIGMH